VRIPSARPAEHGATVAVLGVIAPLGLVPHSDRTLALLTSYGRSSCWHWRAVGWVPPGPWARTPDASWTRATPGARQLDGRVVDDGGASSRNPGD
jgi:hypothetical protein